MVFVNKVLYLMKQYFKFYLAVPSMNCLLSPELIEAAAQCGTKSFQIMAGVFDGFEVTAELYSYEGPFGVGYGVLGFTPGKPNPKRRFLGVDELADSTDSTFEDPYIKLARQTIETFVGTGQKIAPPEDLPDEMTIKQAGVFDTHKGGQLRGCIGTISPTTDSIARKSFKMESHLPETHAFKMNCPT